MTKSISRKMAVDCLLWRIQSDHCVTLDDSGEFLCFRCPICDKPILPDTPVQFDHTHADIHGGPHEYQNLRPVHSLCHKLKTKNDIQANAKIKRLLNPKPSKTPMKSSGKKIPSRPFPKRIKKNASA